MKTLCLVEAAVAELFVGGSFSSAELAEAAVKLEL